MGRYSHLAALALLGTCAGEQQAPSWLTAMHPGAFDARGASAAGLTTSDDRTWPGGVMRYVIRHESDSIREYIAKAIAHWEQYTCLRFEPCASPETCEWPFATFRDGDGCFAWVGVDYDHNLWTPSETGVQEDLANNIWLKHGSCEGAVVHEIGHLLGLRHEQQRKDQDEFIKIYYDQIQGGMDSQFRADGGRDIGPYDYASVMHYPGENFGKGLLPTLEGPVPTGVGGSLSLGDRASIAFLYNDCTASFPAPRCITSRHDALHVIPHSKPFEFDISVVYTKGSPVRVTYPLMTAAAAATSYASGEVIRSDAEFTRVSFTPRPDQAGAFFTLAATFTAEDGSSSVCGVDVQVAASDLVCHGLASTDPNVCSGRGVCTANAKQRCDCEAGFGGDDCSLLARCTANIVNDFDDGAGYFVKRVEHITQVDQDNFVGASGGSLGVVVDGEERETATMEFKTPQQPSRVTFSFKAQAASNPTVRLRAKTGRVCAALYYSASEAVWSVGDFTADVAPGEWAHIDLGLDWATGKRVVRVNGRFLGEDTFNHDCTSSNAPYAGVQQVHIQGEGWVDNFQMWCGGYVALGGSLLAAKQKNLVFGGESLELAVVGTDAWAPTAATKQALIAGISTVAAVASLLTEELVSFSADAKVATIGPLPAAPEYVVGGDDELIRIQLDEVMFARRMPVRTPAEYLTVALPVGCDNLLLANGEEWYSVWGTRYGCAWYGREPSRCEEYGGSQYFREGMGPKDACCVCGGGVAGTDLSTPTPLTPATDAPATDAPATPAPATDAPATDAPATDAPATDAPATPAPATDAPATLAPATSAPSASGAVTLTLKDNHGVVVEATSGSISDGYDPMYENDLRREVTVRGTNCLLEFISFDVQIAEGCAADSFQVQVGGSVRGGCGNAMPLPMQLDGDEFTVRLVTDGSVTAAGFELRFECAGAPTPTVPTTASGEVGLTLKDNHGAVVTATSGTIDDGYAPMYENSLRQSVTVIGRNCLLEFLEFSVEGHSSCGYDVVTISVDGAVQERLCGSDAIAPMQLGGGRFAVELKTDGSVRDAGFRIAFTCEAPTAFEALAAMTNHVAGM
eukprot:TRINITY_DN960_c0_g1_i3.p1 TRINITY_DN960_c0_g1~~TRINITY_DN960_c0_g1_i3.p1  ORF type:complete len:1084 (+),score=298.11 TRINITY_DN960_c0_g1_i3:63-3314(+)